MIGGNLHSLQGFGRELAQIDLPRKRLLAQRVSCARVLPAGEAAIPVTLEKHLFRTPSLGGQSFPFRNALPIIFPSAVSLVGAARGFADLPKHEDEDLHISSDLRCLSASGLNNKKGWRACELHGFGLHWQWLAGWRPAATRSANRHLLAQRSARARRRFLTATLLRAQPLARRATCSIASKTPVSADRHLTLFAGGKSRPILDHAGEPAGRGFSARGFLRASLPKTKDVPCSKRS